MDQANADNPQEKPPLVRLKVHVYTVMYGYVHVQLQCNGHMYVHVCMYIVHRTDCFVHVSKIHLYMFIENNKVCM